MLFLCHFSVCLFAFKRSNSAKNGLLLVTFLFDALRIGNNPEGHCQNIFKQQLQTRVIGTLGKIICGCVPTSDWQTVILLNYEVFLLRCVNASLKVKKSLMQGHKYCSKCGSLYSKAWLNHFKVLQSFLWGSVLLVAITKITDKKRTDKALHH